MSHHQILHCEEDLRKRIFFFDGLDGPNGQDGQNGRETQKVFWYRVSRGNVKARCCRGRSSRPIVKDRIAAPRRHQILHCEADAWQRTFFFYGQEGRGGAQRFPV